MQGQQGTERVRKLYFSAEVLAKLEKVAQELADVVGSTLGPRGRYVLIDQDTPIITNDGVTIASELRLDEPSENAIAKVIQQASLRTNKDVGDGTTTAILIASEIVKQAVAKIKEGANPVLLKRGIEMASKRIADLIMQQAEPADEEQLRHVARIAGNNDSTIAELVIRAFNSIPERGIIVTDNSERTETYIEVLNGYSIDQGYVSPYFINNEKGEVVLEDPYILVADARLHAVRPLVPILDKVATSGKPLVIIAEDIEGEILQSLIFNKLNHGFRCVAVRAPEFGIRRSEILQDIATATNAVVVGGDTGLKLENLRIDHLGRAQKVRVTATNTVIIGGFGDQSKISERIAALEKKKYQIGEHDYDWYDQRIAKLAGGICVVKVWAPTEAEREDIKMRLEDALSAVEAAMRAGVVPGGGVVFLKLADSVRKNLGAHFPVSELSEDERLGIQIMLNALHEPARRIIVNSGVEPDDIIEKIASSENKYFGFDALRLKLGNLFQNGVIDPADVLVKALQNAVSAAGILITTNIILA